MNAQTRAAIASRLAEVAAGAGGLTAERVVQDARNQKSPLHGFFEWDDTKAAAAYRVVQARELIRSVTVVVELTETEVRIPRYVHDPRDANVAGYVETVSLATDRSLAIDAIRAEVLRAAGNVRRARSIAEALGLGDEAERMIAGALALPGEPAELSVAA